MSADLQQSERSFGLSVGSVLCAIGVVLVWRHAAYRAEFAFLVGALLIGAGALHPPILARPADLWWRLSRLLGQVNARVMLTVIFVVALTPIALVWRAAGRDPLFRKRSTWRGWSAYPVRYRDRHHFNRMY